MTSRDPHFPGWCLALSVACALLHLVVGLLYVNRFGPDATRGLLRQSGSAYLESFPGWNTDSEMDTAGFNRAATSILATGLPRSREGTVIWRTALYSYFVAACYAVGGLRLWPVAIAQAVISGLICWLLGRTTQQFTTIGHSVAAGWVVGGLYLLNLRVAMYVGYVVPLIPTLFFTTVALWAVTRWKRDNSGAWIVASLVLGTYTSSTFFVVALAGAGWLLLRRASVIGPVLIAFFVAMKFVVTWTNVAGDTAEPNRTGDRGGIFWMSNNPCYERMRPWSLWEWRGSNQWSTWSASKEERERHAMYLARAGQNELRATLLWIRENPGSYLRVCLARLRTEFGPYTGQMSPRNRLISTVIWLLIFPAGFYGLWQWRHEPPAQFVALIIIAVFAFGTLVTEEPYLRYRLPVDLLLTVYAGLAYAGRFCCASDSSNTAAIRWP